MANTKVTGDVIANGTISTVHLADDAITAAKLDSTATGITFADLTVDTNTLYVDAANNRVGIGTTSPYAELSIRSTSPQIYLETPSSGNVQINFNENADQLDIMVNNSVGKIAFGTNSTERMRINSSGNVGIGVTPNSSYSNLQIKTPSSSYGLDLVGRDAGSNSESQITFWNAAQSSVLAAIYNSTSNLYFYTNGDNRMIINSSGNVGIGTDSPGSLLHLKEATLPRITLTKTGIVDWFIGNPSQGTGNNFTIGTNSGSNTEILTITNAANVGIGVTSPSSKLDIAWGGYQTSGYALTFGADIGNLSTRTNNTTKYGIITGVPYTTTNPNIELFTYYSNSASNVIGIGGQGNTDLDGVNLISFLTAPNQTSPGVERMRITSGGDFGFNETTITNPYGQANFTDLNIDGTWGGVISFKLGGTEMGWIGQRNSGNAGMVLSSSSGQDLRFNTNGNNERMIIDSSGTIGINKSSGLNAGGFGSPKIVIKQSVNNEWGAINIEAEGNDAVFGIGTSNDAHILAGSYRATAGYKDIIIKAGGAERLRVDNTQGHIGIGTTSPTNGKLEVQQTATTAALWVQTGGTSSSYTIADFRTGTNASALAIKGNGRVGIGTTNPLELLNVHQTTATAGLYMPISIAGARYQADYAVGIAFRPENNSSAYAAKTAIVGSGGGYGYNMADLHFCFNNSTTITDEVSLSDAKVTMKRSGNVGIGTTTPNAALTVVDNSDGSSTPLVVASGDGAFSTNQEVRINFAQGPGSSFSGSSSLGHLAFAYTGGSFESAFIVKTNTTNSSDQSEKMRVAANGNVGIGTTSPQTRLDVDGGVRIKTVEYTWHRSNPITGTNSYRHYKTTLYAGAGNNTMHIMGGFTLKAYAYNSNGYGEGSCMFHNWSGILYSLSVTNRGQWSNFVRSPYVSSDGYVVIVCEHNTYSQPIIDFYQFYTPYGWRNVTVSGDTTTNSLTGAY